MGISVGNLCFNKRNFWLSKEKHRKQNKTKILLNNNKKCQRNVFFCVYNITDRFPPRGKQSLLNTFKLTNFLIRLKMHFEVCVLYCVMYPLTYFRVLSYKFEKFLIQINDVKTNVHCVCVYLLTEIHQVYQLQSAHREHLKTIRFTPY